MNTDDLFDADAYGDATVRRKRRSSNFPPVEPIAEPWVLLANTSGVIGFHVPKHVDRYATATTLCGVQGHVVEPPSQMVRCLLCEVERTKAP